VLDVKTARPWLCRERVGIFSSKIPLYEQWQFVITFCRLNYNSVSISVSETQHNDASPYFFGLRIIYAL
jgi:hypothetical protein